MSSLSLLHPSRYHDSVTLMLAARQLAQAPGIADAAIVMGTEANKALLREAGLLTPEAASAGPNDLVIAVSGEAAALPAALALAETLLQQRRAGTVAALPGSGPAAAYRPRTLAAAAHAAPGTNLALISVAGRYAADLAWEALLAGLHVFLFSDNVSLEDEIALKRYAARRGLLVMGPGAGTAYLNGAALGFANAVARGPVGLVAAAGTGLQEVACLLDRRGLGLSHGIGAGGRDLKEEVGGLTMLSGLRALQADPNTRVIVLISKPPSPAVAERVLQQAAAGAAPVVVCFLGAAMPQPADLPSGLRFARTLAEAAGLAADLVGAPPRPDIQPAWDAQAAAEVKGGALRALYSGGTLCYEAQVIWRGLLPEPIFSNAPLDPALRLPDSAHSQGHTALDLGEEEFTVGRPHPMIDNDLRLRRLAQEAADPTVRLIVLDVVLGYGAHPDPASELAPAITQARQSAAEAGRRLAVVASITGTELDPQGYAAQAAQLSAAGVQLCPSNAAAARLAAWLVMGRAVYDWGNE
jgi:FdrA protein